MRLNNPIDPHNFPMIHHPLEGDSTLSFSFIWNYWAKDNSVRCVLPLWQTDIIIRPLVHAERDWMVIVNTEFSQFHDMELCDVISSVERGVCHQLAVFLSNCTNIVDLIDRKNKEALCDTLSE